MCSSIQYGSCPVQALQMPGGAHVRQGECCTRGDDPTHSATQMPQRHCCAQGQCCRPRQMLYYVGLQQLVCEGVPAGSSRRPAATDGPALLPRRARAGSRTRSQRARVCFKAQAVRRGSPGQPAAEAASATAVTGAITGAGLKEWRPNRLLITRESRGCSASPGRHDHSCRTGREHARAAR